MQDREKLLSLQILSQQFQHCHCRGGTPPGGEGGVGDDKTTTSSEASLMVLETTNSLQDYEDNNVNQCPPNSGLLMV